MEGSSSAYAACPLFHHIELGYPGLRSARSKPPFIFLVDDFLTAEECAGLVAKVEAASHPASDQVPFASASCLLESEGGVRKR